MLKFVVFLALCLVCVNAFVRRDAPNEPKEEVWQKSLQDFGNTVSTQFKEIFNPETMKNNFASLQEGFNKLVKDFTTPKPSS